MKKLSSHLQKILLLTALLSFSLQLVAGSCWTPFTGGKYFNIITGSTREYALNQPVYCTERGGNLLLGTYDLETNDPTTDPCAIWYVEEFDGGYSIKNVETGQYMGAYKGQGVDNAPTLENTPICYNIAVYSEDETMVTFCQKGSTEMMKADQANMVVLNYPTASDKQHGWILKEVDPSRPMPVVNCCFNIIAGSTREYAQNQPIYVTSKDSKLLLGSYNLQKKDPSLDPYAVWTFEEFDDGFAVKNVQTGQYMGAYKGEGADNAPTLQDDPVCYEIKVYSDDNTMVTFCQKGNTSKFKADQANQIVINYPSASDKQQGWTLRMVDPVNARQEGQVSEITEGYYHFVNAWPTFREAYDRALYCGPKGDLGWDAYQNDYIDNSKNPAYVWYITENEDGTFNIQNVLTGLYIGSPEGRNKVMPTSETPVKQTINYLGSDQWDIVADEWHKQALERGDKDTYEMEVYASSAVKGTIRANFICSWYSGKNDRGAWVIDKISDQTLIDSIKAAGVQEMKNYQTKFAVKEAAKIYSKLFDYKMQSDGLITEADDDDAEHNQFWGTKQVDSYSYYRHLIDGNHSTCFQSSWSSSTDHPQWLQVDLRNHPVKDFTYYFGLRNDSYWGTSEMWTDVTIYATNDETLANDALATSIDQVSQSAGWTKLCRCKDIPKEYATDYHADSGWYYAVDGLADQKFRFLRFYVNFTYSPKDQGMYTIGEFQVYENLPNEGKAPYDYVAGIKTVADQFVAKFEECKKAIAAGTCTAEMAAELQKLTTQVDGMIPDTEAIKTLIDEVDNLLQYFNAGQENLGDIPEEYWNAANKALDDAKQEYLGATADRLKQLQQNLEAAYAACKANRVKPDPDKWYFIVNKARDAEGEQAASFGSIMYMESGNSEEKHWSDVEALKWGYCTDGVEEYTTAVDPYTMWRLVPVDEANNVYVLQNRMSGRYVDYLYSGIRNGVMPVQCPYQLVYLKSGQVKFLCIDTNHKSGGNIYARTETARGKFIGGEIGEADSPAAWDLQEVLDEDYEALNVYLPDNTISIVSFPFALDNADITSFNEDDGWTMYGLKYYNAENNTLGLKKISTVEAGEPFVLVRGDYTDASASHDKVAFAVPKINTFTTEEKVVNGLHAILDYTKNQNGMCNFVDGKLSEIKSDADAFNAFTGVISLKAIQDINPETPADLILSTPADYTSVQAIRTLGSAVTNVFSLDGTLLRKNVTPSNATQNLGKGIYIVGKRKISVK